MKGMKTRHLALGIAVIACGLGVHDRLAREPERRRRRDAWESRVQYHSVLLSNLDEGIHGASRTAAACAGLAEKWAARSRDDLAGHYRQEAAYWSGLVDLWRRERAWRRPRLDATRALAGYVAAEEVAADRAREAEFRRERAALGARWKPLIGDWKDRPAEDLEALEAARSDPR